MGNPGELASRLTGVPVEVVDDSGAPAAEKHVLLYNPPVTYPQLGLRSAAVEEVRRLLRLVDDRTLQTIVFGRTRRVVEVLVKYLRHGCHLVGNRTLLGEICTMPAWKQGCHHG